jgi:hypothetical protein
VLVGVLRLALVDARRASARATSALRIQSGRLRDVIAAGRAQTPALARRVHAAIVGGPAPKWPVLASATAPLPETALEVGTADGEDARGAADGPSENASEETQPVAALAPLPASVWANTIAHARPVGPGAHFRSLPVGVQIGVVCALVLSVCIVAWSAAGALGASSGARTTGAPAAQSGSTATLSPTAAPTVTDTPLPAATATAFVVQAVPPPPPTATPVGCPHGDVNGNPWCYSFTCCTYIYAPPGSFCSYFRCAPGFWQQANGYVEECKDGVYVHSGGRRWSCAFYGGNLRPLLAP